MLKNIFSISALGLGISLAAVASPVAMTAGGTVAPLSFNAALGSPLATVNQSISAPTVSANYTESVYADQSNLFCAGCLDFVINLTATNASGSNDNIERVTTSSFAGFSVIAGYTGTGAAPATVGLDPAGKVVSFNYTNGSTLAPNTSTATLMIETNAKQFTTGYVSIQDGTTAYGNGYAPSAATPEPMSMSLLGAGLAGFGLLGLRRRAAKK